MFFSGNDPQQESNLPQKAAQAAANMAANHPAAAALAAAGLGIALGAILLVRKVYTDFNAVQPLAPDELKRYTSLYQAKLKYFPSEDMPKFWDLDKNKKPTTWLDFKEQGDRLKAEAMQLNAKRTYDHNIRAIMLTHISDFFISVHKRSRFGDIFKTSSWRTIREDGVESMFFGDLADWILTKACNLDPKNPKTMEEYKKVLDYCENIQLVVITDQSDYQRNNPYSTLNHLIKILSNHYQKLQELQNALGFNDLIQQLDNRILGLSSIFLDILYLLIDEYDGILVKSEPIEKTCLKIDRFLSEEPSDQKQAAARNTQFGQWLSITLKCIGLIDSSFKPTQGLSIESFRKHLENRHPNDSLFIKNQLPWGHRSFAKTANAEYACGEKKANDYAFKKRQLHQITVELYYLSQSLIRASKASEHFGDTWMYGHPGGKSTLMELLDSVTEVTDDADLKFTSFWQVYYYIDFKTYVSQNKLNTNDPKYRPLTHIETNLVQEIMDLKQEIKELVGRIKIQAQGYAHTAKDIEAVRIHFMESVLEHRKLKMKTPSDDYKTVEEELEKLRQKNRVPTSDSLPEEHSFFKSSSKGTTDEKLEVSSNTLYQALIPEASTFINYKGHELALFEVAALLLHDDFSKRIDFEPDYALAAEPTAFHSTIQQRIYQNFLYSYNKTVNNWWWISFLGGVNPSKMPMLADLYYAVNALFKQIYANTNLKPNSLEINMIDLLFCDKIKRTFDKYQFYPDNLCWLTSPVTIQVTNQAIQITFSACTTTLLRSELTTIMQNALLSFQAKDNEIKKLQEHNARLASSLTDASSLLLQKDEKIIEQEKIIAEVTKNSSEKDSVINSLEQKLAEFKRVNEELMKQKNSYFQFFTQKEEFDPNNRPNFTNNFNNI